MVNAFFQKHPASSAEPQTHSPDAFPCQLEAGAAFLVNTIKALRC